MSERSKSLRGATRRALMSLNAQAKLLKETEKNAKDFLDIARANYEQAEFITLPIIATAQKNRRAIKKRHRELERLSNAAYHEEGNPRVWQMLEHQTLPTSREEELAASVPHEILRLLEDSEESLEDEEEEEEGEGSVKEAEERDVTRKTDESGTRIAIPKKSSETPMPEPSHTKSECTTPASALEMKETDYSDEQSSMESHITVALRSPLRQLPDVAPAAAAAVATEAKATTTASTKTRRKTSLKPQARSRTRRQPARVSGGADVLELNAAQSSPPPGDVAAAPSPEAPPPQTRKSARRAAMDHDSSCQPPLKRARRSQG